MNRRLFFRNSVNLLGFLSLGTLFAGSFLGRSAHGEEKRRGGADSKSGELPLVDPKTDPTAQGVKYVHNVSEVKDAALKVARNGVPFEKQNCSSCALYIKKEVRGDDEVGTCALFPNKVVKAKGFCASWNKKA